MASARIWNQYDWAVSRYGKLALLWALYFVQGLPFGYQVTALPVMLRERGVSLAAIGAASVLAAPWLLKPLWAPLVDRYVSKRLGRRRSWILPMQLGLLLTMGAAAVFHAAGLTVLLALVVLMNLFAATLDIAVDGLAIDLLSERDLGVGNTAQVVGYKLGMLTGGGLLLWASQWIGSRGLFFAMAALVAIVLLVTVRFREPPEAADSAAPTRGETSSLRLVLRTLKRSLDQPGGVVLLAAVASYKLGESMADAMFKPFAIDAGFTGAQIGLWVGSWGMAFSIAGSALGGLLATKRGIMRALIVTAVLRAVPVAGEWWLAVQHGSGAGVSATGFIIVTCAEHFCGGALTTAMFALMMSRVDKRVGATHYTVLAAVEVLGKTPAAWLSGVIAQAAGYSWLFALATLLSLAFLLLLPPLVRTQHSSPQHQSAPMG